MSHLRLVRDEPPTPPGPRKNKMPPPIFTREELGRLRVSFENARHQYGSWRALAAALGVTYEAVIKVGHGKHPVSPGLVLRLARALRVPVESLYRPLTVASVCPTCGARRAP
ncbi:MAG: helix-turn-helix transcriptional regulator [Polyangiaceae bacterium]